MSISKTADFIYNYDNELISGKEKLSFTASNIKFDIMQDTNQGNYNGNSINFNSMTSQGISPDVLQSWSQAYHDIPTEVTLTIAAIPAPSYTAGVISTVTEAASLAAFKTALKFDTTPKIQNNAISVKSNLHLYDSCQIKWSDIAVTEKSSYNNLYRNLQLLNWDDEKLKIHGKLINYDLDNGESIEHIKDVGEINNKIRISFDDATTTIPTSLESKVNLAQYRRSKMMNYDITGDGTNKLLLENLAINKMGGLLSLADTTMNFHWNLRTPLCLIHDFFDKLPSVGTVNNFDIKFILNAGIASSWKVIYKCTVAAGKVTGVVPVEVVYTKGAGNSCPFLISELGYHTGLNLNPSMFNIEIDKTGGTPIVAGDYYISLNVGTLIGSKTSKANPSAIYLPSIKYNTKLSEQIFSDTTTTVYYNDFIMEEMREVKSGTIRKTFGNQFVKVNKMYIIPILSNGDTQKTNKSTSVFYNIDNGVATGPTMLLPYESPLSSCPNTFNKGLKLYNLQLKVGTQPVYPVELREENDFYHQMLLSYFAEKDDGNSIQSGFNATQLTYDRFRNGYGVYVLDLVQTTDPIQWSTAKTFHLNFNYDSDYVWDFIFLFEQQHNVDIDRASGMIKQQSSN